MMLLTSCRFTVCEAEEKRACMLACNRLFKHWCARAHMHMHKCTQLVIATHHSLIRMPPHSHQHVPTWTIIAAKTSVQATGALLPV